LYFVEGVDKNKHCPAIRCKFCQWSGQHPQASGKKSAPTTSLSRHIIDNCKGWSKQKVSTPGQLQLPSLIQQTPATLNQESVNEQILKFFISGNIPFNQADNLEFQKLITLIKLPNGNAQAPSRKVVRERLRKHHIESETDLKATFNKLASKISLALDVWSTRSMIAFLGKHSYSV
jgi:hypothetical protein